MTTLANWIWRENLKPFVEVLARLSCYGLTDGDRDLIGLGVAVSDADVNPPRFYEYEFHGEHQVSFQIGRDEDPDIVHVQIQLPAVIASKVEVALDLMNLYTLSEFR